MTRRVAPVGRPRVLLAVPESDCHVVVNRLLEFHLRQLGFEVRNLGVCTPSSDIATAVWADRPTAVVLSSQNGHALKDLTPLPADLAARGVRDVPVFIGGKLGVGQAADPLPVRRAFAALGITVVDTFEQLEAELARLAGQRLLAPAGRTASAS
jgi:methylmalonyl-CoA mutase cobalamin-binding subunit